MDTKLIVIVGITGVQVRTPNSPGSFRLLHIKCLSAHELRQGASVADAFLKEPKWRIRGLTRDPSKPAAQALTAQGIEMVRGDLDEPDTLTAAFDGAHAIFAMTDFWQPYFNPSNKEKLKEGQTMNEFCFDIEVRHGKNSAHAAAKVETLERYVYSGLSNATKWSKGKYTWVYHFDGKAKVVEYIKEELPELAKKMSVVQVGLYYNHWKFSPLTAPRKVG